MFHLHGVISRRILLNYRVHPAAVRDWLPQPFEPQLVDGWAMAGICLIQLRSLRPRGLPAWCGAASTSAAIRVAVNWQGSHGTEQGVYIVRRVTASKVVRCLGGRLFPGVHTPARIDWQQTGDEHAVDVTEHDSPLLHLCGRATSDWPTDSVFSSLAECAAFFERGATGYSPTRDRTAVEGLQLCCQT